MKGKENIMMNKSYIDIYDFTPDKEFKLAINFITYFNAKVESYYRNEEYYFCIEFTTEGNYGQITISDEAVIIEHNVFEDFVKMRNYLKEQINQLSPEGEE